MTENKVAVKCELVEWKDYAIKDIGTVVTGNTPPKKDPENYGGNLIWIKPPDLDKKMFVSSSEETISEIGKNKVRLLPKGSVLVSCIGNIGKIAIADCELCTNQQINSIIPNKDIVDSVFLYYAIKRMKFYLEKIASSAVVPLLNKNDFSKIKIKIPPIETQKKISKILERTEKLKDWRAESDELADDYLKSFFLEMFGDPKSNPNGWKYSNFSEIMIGTPQNGLYKHSSYYTRDNSGTPILRIDSFYDGKLKKLNNLKRVNCTNEEIGRFKLENDNIVINRVNSIKYLGKCALVENLLEPTVYESNMMQIRIDRSIINPVYLTKFLCTNFVYNQIVNKAKKAVNQASINQKDVKSLKILLPPIELQNQFADIVQQVESLKNYQSQSKKQIDNLFNTLMQKAFKGELVC